MKKILTVCFAFMLILGILTAFNVSAAENSPPDEPTHPTPTDRATGVSTDPTLSVKVSDHNGDSMDVTFYDASNDEQIGKSSGVASGSTASTTWSGLSESTTYEWYAVADDGEATTDSDTWSFTTTSTGEDSTAPSVLSVKPSKDSVGCNLTQEVIVVFNESMNEREEPKLEQIDSSDPGGWTFEGWSDTRVGSDTASWSHNRWDRGEKVNLVVSEYQDKAENTGDSYGWSFTTVDLPKPPEDVNVAKEDGELVLSWSSPSDTGGSYVTEYKIYRGTSSEGKTLLDTVESTNYTDPSIDKDETYYYEVSTVNKLGEGDRSEEVKGSLKEGSSGVPMISIVPVITTVVCLAYIYRRK